MNLFSELINILTEISQLERVFIVLFVWYYSISSYEIITQILMRRRSEIRDVGQVDYFEIEKSHNEMGPTETYTLGDGSKISFSDSGGDDSFGFFFLDIPDDF